MPSFNKSAAVNPSVKIANKSAPPPSIQLRGYLMKQKHGRCRAWLKRYFVFYGEELRYYKNKKDNKALAVISLDHYSLVPDAQPFTSLNQKQWKYNTFCLVSDDETKFDWPDYFLQAASPEDRAVWVDSLQNHVSQSTTVLEKWLDRLQVSPQDMQALSNSLPKPASTSPVSATSSTSPSQRHALRYFKYTESLNTCTTRSSGKRRPSDFLPSRSFNKSTKLFSSKIFNWTRSKSTNSSASSISLHTSVDDDNTTSKIVRIALELPIIHPSEYNHDDDDPDECILANKDSTATFFLCRE